MSDTHSDGDVDDELLALAGGGDDFSEDGSRPVSRQRSQSRSRSRSRSRSQSARPADSSPPRGSTSKKTSARKRRASAESEDEGEASEPGTPSSQGSAAMDESDSDDDDASPGKASGAEDEDKYPVEGLYTSYAEKKKIENMTEVERELIMFEREGERERVKQKAMLRQLVANNENKMKKRKGGDTDFEDAQRSKKPRAATKSGLDALKRARAEKNDRRNRREHDDRDRRDRSPSYRSSSSRGHRSDDSDVEWASSKRKRSKTPPEEAPPADLRDIERCRLSRTRFARVAFYPGFDEALMGCYVRVHIGPDPETKVPIYRMARIKGFESGRAYAVENDRGKSIVVDQYVIAAHGKAQRNWPWIACSEGNFTEKEWDRYQKICKSEGVPIPKKPELAKKTADINALINREWKDDEVQEKIKRQSALMDRFNGLERARIEQQLAQARLHGNAELAGELQDRLDQYTAPRLAFQTTLKKASPAKTGPSQQDRLAEKNALNRQLNSKNVRQAQLAERHKATGKARETATPEADGGRRRGKETAIANAPASAVAAGGGGDENGTAGDREKEEADRKALETKMAEASVKGGAPMIHTVLTDDDVIGSLDLDIDVEID